MARAISSDSLLSALVEQVDMDPVKGFVMVPKVGEHSIVAGDGRDLADKFRRLKLFYQQVMSRTGWSSYRELDLRFRGQVVAVPTGSASATPVKTALPDTSVVANSIAQPSPEQVKKEVKERKESKGTKPVVSKREAGAGKPKAVMPAQR
jgi:cell division protein FtsQ